MECCLSINEPKKYFLHDQQKHRYLIKICAGVLFSLFAMDNTLGSSNKEGSSGLAHGR